MVILMQIIVFSYTREQYNRRIDQTAVVTDLEMRFLIMPNGRVATFISNRSSPDFALVTGTRCGVSCLDGGGERFPLDHDEALPPYSPGHPQELNSSPETKLEHPEDLPPGYQKLTDESSGNCCDPPPYSMINPELYDNASDHHNIYNISLIHRGPPE